MAYTCVRLSALPRRHERPASEAIAAGDVPDALNMTAADFDARAAGEGIHALVSHESGRRSGNFVHQQCSSHADCKYADSDREFGDYTGTWDSSADPNGDCNGRLHTSCNACGAENVCYWWKGNCYLYGYYYAHGRVSEGANCDNRSPPKCDIGWYSVTGRGNGGILVPGQAPPGCSPCPAGWTTAEAGSTSCDVLAPVHTETVLLGPPSAYSSQTAHNFGASVSVGERFAVVGAPGADAVFVFQLVPLNTEAVATLEAPDKTAGDNFGQAVSLGAGGRWIAVGAPHKDEGSTSNKGAVYVFQQDATGAWSYHSTITSSIAAANDRFGWSVSLDEVPGSHVRVLVGCDYHLDYSGFVEVFELSHSGTWTMAWSHTIGGHGAKYGYRCAVLVLSLAFSSLARALQVSRLLSLTHSCLLFSFSPFLSLSLCLLSHSSFSVSHPLAACR